ncbi:DgyrCDS1242 [Dimorphilus gyrociliatus]|uniref:DgyrCDS1242 n=1 Tax=Dimorphilus gyrociliatus TaxID=2664684 RepID=A0A7I8V6Z4_9ANNE|nr:DgyrCDS1242 [Dimorphilus gyrociliatus]
MSPSKETQAALDLQLPTGRKMPILGYGTFLANDEEELKVALRSALDAGYRKIDTALIYNNEHVIGEILQEYFQNGKLKRDDIFVTTKLWHNYMESKERIKQGIQRSLKNLKLDYVDLYLVHLPIGRQFTTEDELNPIDENGNGKFSNADLCEVVWRGMENLVDAGLTKSIGVSNFNSKQIERINKVARIPIANNQIEIHSFFQQWDLVKFCQDNGITVTAYSPLAAPGASFRPQDADTNPLICPIVKEIAEKYKKTPAQILLRSLLERNIAIIPKSVTLKRISENLDIFDFKLDEDSRKKLKSLDKGLRIFKQDWQKGMVEHPEYPFNIPF